MHGYSILNFWTAHSADSNIFLFLTLAILKLIGWRCGPCKVMAPKFQELSEKHLDVVFMKLDCNQENKVCLCSWLCIESLCLTIFQPDGVVCIVASGEGVGNQGCSDLQDPKGQQGSEGSNGGQIWRSSFCHRYSEIKLIWSDAIEAYSRLAGNQYVSRFIINRCSSSAWPLHIWIGLSDCQERIVWQPK